MAAVLRRAARARWRRRARAARSAGASPAPGTASGSPANNGSPAACGCSCDVDRAHLAPGRVVVDRRHRARARAAGARSRCRTAACRRARPRATTRRCARSSRARSVTIAPDPVISTPAKPSRAGSGSPSSTLTTTAASADRPAATRIQCGKRPCRRMEGTGWPVSRIRKGFGKAVGNVAFKSAQPAGGEKSCGRRIEPVGRATANVY